MKVKLFHNFWAEINDSDNSNNEFESGRISQLFLLLPVPRQQEKENEIRFFWAWSFLRRKEITVAKSFYRQLKNYCSNGIINVFWSLFRVRRVRSSPAQTKVVVDDYYSKKLVTKSNRSKRRMGKAYSASKQGDALGVWLHKLPEPGKPINYTTTANNN